MTSPIRILALDDQSAMRNLYRAYLGATYHLDTVATAENALELARKAHYTLYLVDLMLPGMNGIDFVRSLKRFQPDPQVIFISQTEDIDLAVAAFKEQPVDFLRKPIRKNLLLHAVKKNIDAYRFRMGYQDLSRESANDPHCPEPISGRSPVMREFWNSVQEIARSTMNFSVLITGESGTGKEVVARQLHRLSYRAGGPFTAMNCALLTPEMAASELLGIEKGVATGVVSRPGKFRVAEGGTLFLDEVAELPIQVQPVLLRVLQERVVTPVGGRTELPVDVRVIAATNKSIAGLIDLGRFRQDLFFRLSTIELSVPPLRDHREDIPDLLAHLYRRHGGSGDVPIPKDEMPRWLDYEWPGNVRQLENELIKRMITGKPFQPIHKHSSDSIPDSDSALSELLTGKTFQEVRYLLFTSALKRSNGNIRQAARALKISHSSLWEFVKKHNLNLST